MPISFKLIYTKYYLKLKLLAAVVLLSACKNDEGLDCSLVDCMVDQLFTIEFLDGQGNNLIENGTYDLTKIVVSTNGNDLYVNTATTENYLLFYYEGESGQQVYDIRLNSSETDILVLDLSKKEEQNECCGPYFDVDKVSYNGEFSQLTNLHLASDKITVIK